MIRKLLVMSLALVLSACGGHGFEGKYESKVESKMLGGMAKMMPKTTLTIGTDYIESKGKRVAMDDIFVRESEDKSYLILVKGESEQAFEIVADDILVQDMGMAKIKFVKVD